MLSNKKGFSRYAFLAWLLLSTVPLFALSPTGTPAADAASEGSESQKAPAVTLSLPNAAAALSDSAEGVPSPAADPAALPPEADTHAGTPAADAALSHTLASELTLEAADLKKRLEQQETRYQTYRGLAAAGYSLTGAGLGFIILDSLIATPKEDPKSIQKLGALTYSAVPFIGVGVLFSVLFHLLQEQAKEAKVLTESNLYDIKSELEMLPNYRTE